MFSILKLIIWIAGVLAIAYFVLPYFGYELNINYWNESKTACQKNLERCRSDLIRTGLDGAKENCNFQCVDPKILIKKQ